ncbi:MAG: hypothetical protein ACRCX2_32385 [Paraclostridium sp.]
MNFPIMLRSTYDFEVGALNDKISILENENDKFRIRERDLDSIAEVLDNRNCELNIKRTALEVKLSKCTSENEKLKDEIKLLKQRIIEKDQCLKDTFEKVEGLEKCSLDLNRKVWSNDESKRQLRVLAEEILDADKINKNEVARHINNMTMLMGGGMPVKIVKAGDEKAKG